MLAIELRSIFSRCASSSCVHRCSVMYRLNDNAFSIALRSFRCRFSMIASSATNRSSASRTSTRIVGRPASTVARNRRSPLINWYRSPTRRTKIGCNCLCSLSDSASDSSSDGLNCRRGWNGLASMSPVATSSVLVDAVSGCLRLG